MRLPEYKLGEKPAIVYLGALNHGINMSMQQAMRNPKGSIKHVDLVELMEFFAELLAHVDNEMKSGNVGNVNE